MEAACGAELAPTEMGVRAITTDLKCHGAESPAGVCLMHHLVLTPWILSFLYAKPAPHPGRERLLTWTFRPMFGIQIDIGC